MPHETLNHLHYQMCDDKHGIHTALPCVAAACVSQDVCISCHTLYTALAHYQHALTWCAFSYIRQSWMFVHKPHTEIDVLENEQRRGVSNLTLLQISYDKQYIQNSSADHLCEWAYETPSFGLS